MCEVCGGLLSSRNKTGICNMTADCIAEYHRKWKAARRGGGYSPRRYCERCGTVLHGRNKGVFCMSSPECKQAHWREAHGWAYTAADASAKAVLRVDAWRRDNPERWALQRARHRARRSGLRFDLALDDLPPIPDQCPALGIPLKSSPGRATDNSPSLDRVIPSLGYVRGNVRWLSYRANAIKRDASVGELRAILAYMELT